MKSFCPLFDKLRANGLTGENSDFRKLFLTKSYKLRLVHEKREKRGGPGQ